MGILKNNRTIQFLNWAIRAALIHFGLVSLLTIQVFYVYVRIYFFQTGFFINILHTCDLFLTCVTLVVVSMLFDKNKRGFVVFFGIVFILGFYSLEFVLSIYRFIQGFSLDITFVWHNVSDIYRTVQALGGIQSKYLLAYTCLVLLMSSLLYGVMMKIINELENSEVRVNKLVVFLAVVGCGYFVLMPTELKRVMTRMVRGESNIELRYKAAFEESLLLNKQNQNIEAHISSDENIFLFQLESLNGQLVREGFAPQLVSYATKRGVLLPNIQGVSVQTMRAQEVILCSVYPSDYQALARMTDLWDGLHCLPDLLRDAGYTTLYFQSYQDLSFYNTSNFMKMAGFDEVHAADIMRTDDPMTGWGYREDVFYDRVFEYLEKYKNKKIFVLIAVSTTNHYPFHVPVGFNRKQIALPFTNVRTTYEKVANTTFVQDVYFGDMMNNLYTPSYSRSSHAFIYGDHSWPIGEHYGNIHNESGAYQENFVTSAAYIPIQGTPAGKFNSINGFLYSQVDFAPTLLEIVGLHDYRFVGHSFYRDLTSGKKSDRNWCLVSIQPFTEKTFSLIKAGFKYTFNVAKNMYYRTELDSDYYETTNTVMNPINSEGERIFSDCFNKTKVN